MVSMDSQRFECDCSSFQHSFRISIDPDEGDVFLEMDLITWLPWHKRLWCALKYVLSPGVSKFGPYDEVILRREDHGKIRDILASAEKIAQEKKK